MKQPDYIKKICSGDGSQNWFISEEFINPEELVHEIVSFLKQKYKYNVCKWEPDNTYYPDYMFLGGDRGILAYVIFKFVGACSVCDGIIATELNEILNTIRFAESRLDRPVFFVYLVNDKEHGGLYFEYLISQGIDKNHILVIELDDDRNVLYRNPIALGKYVREFCNDSSMYYVFFSR